MKNILLVFLNELEYIDEFNEIIDKFAESNYTMYLLDNIKEDEHFSADSLPELVEFYKSQHGSVNKIVILSNSRDLVFCWYRCYNSVIDDFIYFIDKESKNYFDENDRHFEFYDNLASFNQIEEERILGKLYFNINFNNYSNEIRFILGNNDFRYFDSLNNYDFNEKKLNKSNISKKYIFNGYEYVFGKDSKSIETIKIFREDKIILQDNDRFLKSILTSIYIIPYITSLFYKDNNLETTRLLVVIYENLKQINKKDQKKIFKELYSYISKDDIDFKEKMYISSLLVMINNGDERLAQLIIETLLEDVEYLEYHYSCIYNMFFYKHNDALLISNYVYSVLRKEFIKLGEFYKVKEQINIDRKRNKNDKFKVAIHYDQLLSLNHSPTALALQMAKNLKKYYNNCEIKIFIEDNFIVGSNEVIFPYVYSSVNSYSCREIHNECLNGLDVEVYYSNSSITKGRRISEIIKEINDFDPDIIYSTSSMSIAIEILYQYYPIIYQTHGEMNFSTLSDAYVLYGDLQKENLLKVNKDIALIDEKLIYINEQAKAEQKQIKEDYKKENLSIRKESFVMVTVGNRLDGELSDEFIDLIVSFIRDNRNVVWILVGGKEIYYIMDKYNDLITERKIIKINYEEDLLSLYKICDVYINPVRHGGAGSVFLAMYAGIPVIVEKNSQDSVFVVGKENCVENDKEAYLDELSKIYNDKNYKKNKGKLMLDIIKHKKSRAEYIEEYAKIFRLAEEHFYNRC